jgi:hypothetical protein
MASRILDELDPEYLQQQATKVLHRFLDKSIISRNNTITEPIGSYQSKWWSNQYVRGTYSYRSMDSESMAVWPSDLAKPILHSETGKPV